MRPEIFPRETRRDAADILRRIGADRSERPNDQPRINSWRRPERAHETEIYEVARGGAIFQRQSRGGHVNLIGRAG